MASSSTLKALGFAAQAGGNYFSQIHAEAQRTKRLAEAREDSEKNYQRGRDDFKTDTEEARKYAEEQKLKNAETLLKEDEAKAVIQSDLDDDTIEKKRKAAELLKSGEPTEPLKGKELQLEHLRTLPVEEYNALYKTKHDEISFEELRKQTNITHRDEAARKANSVFVAEGHTSRADVGHYTKIAKLLRTTNTGMFEESKLAAKKFLDAVGINVDISSIANAETLQTLLGDEVMKQVAKTKGAVSDREMKLFQVFSAGFGKTTLGNQQIIEFKAAVSRRQVERSDKILEWRNDSDMTPVEIQLKVRTFADDNPLENYSDFNFQKVTVELDEGSSFLTKAQLKELSDYEAAQGSKE